MSKRFDEAAFRQRLIAEGTPPEQAFDIARKMAEARLQHQQAERSKARIEAQEEGRLRALEKAGQGPLAVSRHLPDATPSSEAAAAPVAPAAEKRKAKPRAAKAARVATPEAAKLPRPARKAKGPAPLPDQAFSNQQLSLFQSFLANDDAQRDLLSNAVDLWDSIPRYSVSRRKQDELRQPGGGTFPSERRPFSTGAFRSPP